MAKASKAQEAGWKLVSFIGGPEGQLHLARRGGFTPTRKSLYAEADKAMAMPQSPLFTEFQKYGNLRLMAPRVGDISRILSEELALMWSGKEEARTAGLRAAEKVNGILKENPQRP